MPNVKFIFFDVGGVLVKDFSCTKKWEEMKQGLGISLENSDGFEKLWQEYAQERVCVDFDVDELVPILKSQLKLNLPENYSLLDDFVNRFDRNDNIWQIVTETKKQFKIGLLTNMYPRMLSRLKQEKLLDDIKWEAVVDSSEVKYQKPDKEIFAYAQQAAQVNPEQILFIDNTKSHLEVAKQHGWQVYHYDSCDYEKSNKELKKYLE